jgi:hypothetical protein
MGYIEDMAIYEYQREQRERRSREQDAKLDYLSKEVKKLCHEDLDDATENFRKAVESKALASGIDFKITINQMDFNSATPSFNKALILRIFDKPGELDLWDLRPFGKLSPIHFLMMKPEVIRREMSKENGVFKRLEKANPSDLAELRGAAARALSMSHAQQEAMFVKFRYEEIDADLCSTGRTTRKSEEPTPARNTRPTYERPDREPDCACLVM